MCGYFEYFLSSYLSPNKGELLANVKVTGHLGGCYQDMIEFLILRKGRHKISKIKILNIKKGRSSVIRLEET